jgi:glutathione synthase/RimK-type ligase-like ATP-grasp enzyme
VSNDGFVALATATSLPHPDEDEAILVEALTARGVPTRVVAWDDPAEDLTAARACIVRSTWNYVHKFEAFLAWVDRCARLTALWNPPAVLRWNSHKGYLLELERQGIPVVPTRFVAQGERPSLATLGAGWDELVVKPAVSAGSFATVRVDRASLAKGEAHLHRMTESRDMLVQRYEPSVDDYGERALVWIDGTFTHAVRKSTRFSGDAESVSREALPIAPDEVALADRVLAAVPHPLLYARVDLVRDADGQPRLMELELIEPSLFLDRSRLAVERFADAIARA